MTSFTRTWDTAYEAQPADTEQASGGGDQIRDLKTDTRERMEVDHSFDGDTNDGAHKKVTLLEQASNPTSAANTGFLFTKDVSGVTEVFYMDSAGTVKQLTSSGVLNVSLNSKTLHQSSGLDVKTQKSIDGDNADGIQLANDAASPGNRKFYGTDASGTKGWFNGFTHEIVNTGNPAVNATSTLHSLGVVPDFVYGYLVCDVSDHNWAVGDVVPLTGQHNISVGASSSNVFTAGPAAAADINGPDKNGGTANNLTLTSWTLYVLIAKFGS